MGEEARRLLYILGVRERTDKRVRQLVLDDPAPFVPLAVKKRGKEIDYQAKTVTLAGRRYIVSRAMGPQSTGKTPGRIGQATYRLGGESGSITLQSLRLSRSPTMEAR